MRFRSFAVVACVAAGLAFAVAPSGAEEDGYHADILRRIQHWEGAPAAPRGLTLTPAADGPARGFALSIGLNRVDPKAYGGWDGALTGCVNDAKELVQLLKDQSSGFEITELRDEQATRAAVRDQLGRLAAIARPGDLVIMGFAGHGGQVKDFNGDEEDGLDETLCLYDGQMIDDELVVHFARFAPGVKVLVIADSCHSGTSFFKRAQELRKMVTMSSHERVLPEFRDRAKLLDEEAVRRQRGLPSLVRALPENLPGFREGGIPDNPALAAEYERYGRTTPSPLETIRTVQAAVVLVTSCQESQFALDGPVNGLFTSALKDMWAQRRFQDRTYRELFKEVAREMPQFQQPTYAYFGTGASRFFNERPFAAR